MWGWIILCALVTPPTHQAKIMTHLPRDSNAVTLDTASHHPHHTFNQHHQVHHHHGHHQQHSSNKHHHHHDQHHQQQESLHKHHSHPLSVARNPLVRDFLPVKWRQIAGESICFEYIFYTVISSQPLSTYVLCLQCKNVRHCVCVINHRIEHCAVSVFHNIS